VPFCSENAIGIWFMPPPGASMASCFATVDPEEPFHLAR
jgi:hypothetical protein